MSLVSRLFERRAGVAPVIGRARRDRVIDDVRTRVGAVVEPMRKRHIRAIMAIEHQVYPRPWTMGIFHNELDGMARRDRYYVVLKLDGQLVGYAGMMYALDEAHITNIAIDPRCQRAGLGTRLMIDLMDESRRREKVAMSLEVRISNVVAQALYGRFGFVSEGIRPKYYENVEDAMVMWCRGIDTMEYTELLNSQRRAVAER